MSHRRAAVLASVAACAFGAALLAGCGADVEPHTTPTSDQSAGIAQLTAEPTPTVRLTAKPAPPGTPAPPPPAAAAPAVLPGTLAFHVQHRTQLRTAPHGKVVATIPTKTEFKSPTILAVVHRRPGWVQVRTSVAKHTTGWVPLKAGGLFSEPRTIVIDLSRRTLSVYHRGHRSGVYKVAVGTDVTPTPRGKFAITDRLTVPPGTDYGCCILALTARQPKILQGWGGGDRVAIHATPELSAIGRSVSHGCVRATDETLRRLMRQMRLGAQVTIHA
jgi:lipoprotein-anchoring transpeptidase ErfK/SrfK